ncbi:MAG: hypothetical protein R6X10_05695 [Desulfobacterales bacterium]
MENIAFAQPIIRINRVVVENTWNILSLLQDQNERTARTILEQGNQLAAEGQRALNEWVDEYKKGQAAVQKTVEENHTLLEGLFSKTEKTTIKKSKKK